MIRFLSIRDLAVIDTLELELGRAREWLGCEPLAERHAQAACFVVASLSENAPGLVFGQLQPLLEQVHQATKMTRETNAGRNNN